MRMERGVLAEGGRGKRPIVLHVKGGQAGEVGGALGGL